MTILGNLLDDGTNKPKKTEAQLKVETDETEKKKKMRKDRVKQEDSRQIKEAVAAGIDEGLKRNQPKNKTPSKKDDTNAESKKTEKNDSDGDDVHNSGDDKSGGSD